MAEVSHPIPDNEAERLIVLDSLGIDYDAPLDALEGLAKVASRIANTPIALISLVGDAEQRFAANVGLDGVAGTGRDVAFCAHAIMDSRQLVIPDATMDPRFAGNPLVTGAPGIRAYAGSVLEPQDGARIGTLCVIDTKPRDFSEDTLEQLNHLCNAATRLLLAERDRRYVEDLLDTEILHRRAAQKRAETDPLTGLLNHGAFQAKVDAALDAGRDDRALAVIDVDRFKLVNDRLGHPFGDDYLIAIAGALRNALGGEAVLGRIGGDEFAALLPPAPTLEQLQRLEHLRAEMKAGAAGLGHPELGQLSIGLCATGATPSPSFATLYQLADVALYASKDLGRDRTTVYSRQLEARYNLRSQRARFARALADDEIVAAFQPQVNLSTGDILAVEVLARWRDPRRGLVPAEEFSQLLKDPVAAPELTRRMLSAAIAARDAWLRAGVPKLRFAVNVTAHDLADPNFVDDLDWVLTEAGFPWESLIIDVPETAICGNTCDQTNRSLCRMRASGGKIALDDFGTGSAGLTHLRDWPIDILKIDRGLVAGMLEDPKVDAILASIIGLGRKLGLTTVATGIGNEATAIRLHRLGCETGQGFHIGRPMNQDRALRFLLEPLCDDRLKPAG